MPITRPDVPGDQPLITTQSGSEGGGEYSNTRATPEAFGAGVGGYFAGEYVSGKVYDYVTKPGAKPGMQ